MIRTLTLACAVALPQWGHAQDLQCNDYDGTELCDCAALAQTVKICGSWEDGWANLPPEAPALAMLTSSLKGIATITGTTEAMPPLSRLRADYLASSPELVDIRALPKIAAEGFDSVSFTGTSTRATPTRSPVAVTIMTGPIGTFVVETVYINAFQRVVYETLSAEMQADHTSLFDQIEVSAP